MTETEAAEMADWIRARPPVVQDLIRRFPPGSVVRGTRPLLCPAPGDTAIVVSYQQSGTVNVHGRIGGAYYQRARAEALEEFLPADTFKAECDPDSLEVVEYGPISPDDVEAALA